MNQNYNNGHAAHNKGNSNHQCMSSLCTCNNPKHRCPTEMQKHKFTANTRYRQEFVSLSPTRVNVYKTPDNLHAEKGFNGNTLYRNDYCKKDIQVETAKEQLMNNKVKDAIVKNNAQSHIRDLLSGHNNPFEAEKQKPNRGVYVKPQEFINPKDRRVHHTPMTETTQYRKDFRPRSVSNNSRYRPINYDNLVVHNPGVKFVGTTNYKAEHCKKNVESKYDRELYNLTRQENNEDHLKTKDTKICTDTEYRKNFMNKQQDMTDCPLNHLPKVPQPFLAKNNHVYYNKQKHEWQTSEIMRRNKE